MKGGDIMLCAKDKGTGDRVLTIEVKDDLINIHTNVGHREQIAHLPKAKWIMKSKENQGQSIFKYYLSSDVFSSKFIFRESSLLLIVNVDGSKLRIETQCTLEYMKNGKVLTNEDFANEVSLVLSTML